MFHKIPAIIWGISIGVLVSIAFGLVYLFVLGEPGSTFYLFAALVFLGGPLIAGVVTVAKTAGPQRGRAFFFPSFITFGIVSVLFFFIYLVQPIFARTSVQLPEVCNREAGNFNPPPHLAYPLPDGDVGILIASNPQFALVSLIDYQQPPFPSTVFLVDKSNDIVTHRMDFNDDIISAAFDEFTLYLFNDKIGYFIDARTGEPEKSFMTMDNYGGLSESDRPVLMAANSTGEWHLETSAVITSWNSDGSVKSRRYLTFDGTALGCFVEGATHNVTVIK